MAGQAVGLLPSRAPPRHVLSWLAVLTAVVLTLSLLLADAGKVAQPRSRPIHLRLLGGCNEVQLAQALVQCPCQASAAASAASACPVDPQVWSPRQHSLLVSWAPLLTPAGNVNAGLLAALAANGTATAAATADPSVQPSSQLPPVSAYLLSYPAAPDALSRPVFLHLLGLVTAHAASAATGAPVIAWRRVHPVPGIEYSAEQLGVLQQLRTDEWTSLHAVPGVRLVVLPDDDAAAAVDTRAVGSSSSASAALSRHADALADQLGFPQARQLHAVCPSRLLRSGEQCRCSLWDASCATWLQWLLVFLALASAAVLLLLACVVSPVSADNSIAASAARSYLGLFSIVTVARLCDGPGHLVAHASRPPWDPLVFFTVLLLIFAALAWGSWRVTAAGKPALTDAAPLSRPQTEEWRGWMQIWFVLYHYFRAKPTYKLIRVFIACYVWMTGYGHYRYFDKTKDYSAWRMLHVLGRLNVLVVLLCVMMEAPYILYYICGMHTWYFLVVYFTMAVQCDRNADGKFMATKLAVCLVLLFLLHDWPAPPVFHLARLLLQDGDGHMHEWYFRTGLDHYAAWLGMLCAWLAPSATDYVARMSRRTSLRLIFLSLLAVAVVWCPAWSLDNPGYNALHPVIGLVPVLAYTVVRNALPIARLHHVAGLAWCGRITLETYLLQFHLWLADEAKSVLVVVPGAFWLNFLVTTGVFILLSFAAFTWTHQLVSALLTDSPSGKQFRYTLQLVLMLVIPVSAFTAIINS